MSRSAILRFAFVLAILTLGISIPAHAQYPGYLTNSDDTGFPNYGAFVSSSIDTVNLFNQNLILHIPILSRKGRGIDFNATAMYQSKMWVVDTSVVPIAGTALFNTYYHWRPNGGNIGLVTGVGGGVGYTEQEYSLEPCPYDYSDPPVVLVRSNWVYVTPDGTTHQLPLRKTYGVSGFAGCWTNFEPDNLVGHTDDGQVQVDITNDVLSDWYHSGIKITRQDGSQDGMGSTPFSYRDTNGNFVTLANPDTLGRQPITSGTSGWQYVDSNGTTQSVTFTTTTLNITTTFPTTSYDAYHSVIQYSGTIGVTSSITLANGLSYQFSYDDPANPGHPNPFGEITKVTLPTGGYIKYKYGFVASDPGPQTSDPIFTAYLDSRGLVEKDVSEDGSTERVWTYGGTGPGIAVTDPLGNQEIHIAASCGTYTGSTTWFPTPFPLEGTVIYKDSSGSTIKTVANDYGCDVGPVYSAQQGQNVNPNADYTEGFRNSRIIRTTVTLGDTGQVSKSETDYGDCYSYSIFSTSWTDCRANPTETREYDYGSSSAGPLIRKADISYWHNQTAGAAYLTGHIWNRVYEKDVYDGPTSALMAATQYNYDSTAITATSSVPQHDYTNFLYTNTLRGNVTQIKRLLTSSSTWLTTTNYYNDVGNLVRTTDPGTHDYYLYYDDNFTDGTDRHSQAFLTHVVGPVTNGVNHIEGKQYYWNTGLTAAVCGQNAPSPASCTNTYSPSAGSPVADYAKYTYDAMGRPYAVTHGDGGTTSFSFTEPSSPSPSSRISVSSTSAIDGSTNLANSVTIDGLGRVIKTQETTPCGTVTVDTLYDEVGRVHSASNPYCTTGDPTYGITSNVYDGAGRVITLVPPDGTTTSNNASTVYSGNSITVTDQAGKQRRSFTDALGRLTEVDEPGATSGATASNGYVVISGTEQSGGGSFGTASVTFGGSDQYTMIEQDPSCNLYDCGGNCLSWSNGSRDGSPTFVPLYDSGSVSVVVDGHSYGFGYSSSTTPTGLATVFATAINAYSGSPVNATSSGSVLYLTTKTHTSSSYSLSTSSSTSDPGDFGSASYSASPSGSTVSGGSSDFADAGSIWVNVGGVTTTVSYGSGGTPTSVGSALAAAINANTSMYVTAAASGTTVSFTTTGTGGGTGYSLSTGSSSSFPGTFSPSFSSTPSGPTLGGGSTPALSLLTPAITLYTYDALDHLICVEQHGNTTGTGCSSTSSYDASSAWRVRRFAYDSLGRTTSSTNPESGTSTFTYDSDGNVLTKTSPKQNQTSSSTTVVTTLTYDALHRVLTKTFNDGTTPAVTIAYDGTTISGCSPTLTAADPIGRRTSMCDAAGWEAWSYDSRGQIVAERRSTNSVTKSTAYTYNFHGNITSVTYPSGRTVNYTYNIADQPTSAADTAHSITYASSALYNAPGALTYLQEGSTLITTAFYTSRLQPCRISVKNTGTAPTTCTDATVGNVMDFAYGFNLGSADNGNVASIANNINSARGQTYTYDELNRVSTAKTQATSGTYSWGLAFTYDPWANLLSASVTQGSAYSFSVYADSSNRIHNTGGAFTYDAAGNLTADPINSAYTYDAEGELTSAAGVTYAYDGDGNRVKKSSGKLYWYGNTVDPLAESDASGNVTAEYIFVAGKRIAMLTLSSGAVNYYVADHLGSSHVVTNSSGTILDDSDFYPFGGERSYSSSSGNNYKFTGKERDTESGLDDFAARFYTSNYGRFLSPDDSKYAHPADPQSFNLYGYVANNPINSVDPTGHTPEGANGRPRYLRAEGGGGPTAMGSGGSVETEMDVSFLGALSGNDMSGATSTPSASVTAAQEQNNEALAMTRNDQDADTSSSNAGTSGSGEQKTPAQVQNENADVASAKKYLSGSKEMREVISAFESGNFHIKIIHDGQDRYDPNSRTVYWDPHSALKTTGGGKQSPALGLGHEMAHATGSSHDHLVGTLDSKFDNKEERRVILNYENRAAKELGESMRQNHDAFHDANHGLYTVKCPTCR